MPTKPRPEAIEAIRARQVRLSEAGFFTDGDIDILLAELTALRQRLSEAEQENERFRRENLEIHAMLTGKGEMAWAMTHPDGPTTEAGNALSVLQGNLFKAESRLSALHRALTAKEQTWRKKAHEDATAGVAQAMTSPREYFGRVNAGLTYLECADDLATLLRESGQ